MSAESDVEIFGFLFGEAQHALMLAARFAPNDFVAAGVRHAAEIIALQVAMLIRDDELRTSALQRGIAAHVDAVLMRFATVTLPNDDSGRAAFEMVQAALEKAKTR